MDQEISTELSDFINLLEVKEIITTEEIRAIEILEDIEINAHTIDMNFDTSLLEEVYKVKYEIAKTIGSKILHILTAGEEK